MPELQAHAERLTEHFAGAELSGFRALTFTALKTVLPAPDDAIGHPLRGIDRLGKYLLVRFEPATFVVHLMQGGRLTPDEKQAAKPRGGLARWTFADGRALLLSEMAKEKRAGVWVVAGEITAQPPLEGLGPDAAELTLDELRTSLTEGPMRVHGFLRDQRRIAGIGRRLASEVCHRARLSPFATTTKLGDEDVERLHAAIGDCIADALAVERDRDAMSKSAERPGHVYHRDGEDCPVCGDVIRAIEYTSYTINYCPTCQTGGKVLADNTTSKFLK
nr:DNA-formamidopyrimidine glycosylase family protein [Rhabdothermincola salaria]